MTPENSSRRPSLSIVITCYNYARYVGEAIDSALAQTLPLVQVIVVDDGSTDDSAVVIDRYHGRVQTIRQSNQGHVAAFNRGFVASTGDIVMFLDADDVLEPRAAEKVAAVWHEGCAKVQFDLTIIDAAGHDLGRRFCHFVDGYDAQSVQRSFEATGTYRWPVTAGNAYSRWFLRELLPLEVRLGPDGLLNTVAPVYGEVVTIPACLARYRLHGANLWSSNGLDVSRLPDRISARRAEIRTLAAHAEARGVALPQVDVLDHELPFLNYRLMALRLGQSYEGSHEDRVTSLWAAAMRFLHGELMPWSAKLVHAAWFCVICLAPRPLAAGLIRLRFQRARLTQPFRLAWHRRFIGRGDRVATSGGGARR